MSPPGWRTISQKISASSAWQRKRTFARGILAAFLSSPLAVARLILWKDSALEKRGLYSGSEALGLNMSQRQLALEV